MFRRRRDIPVLRQRWIHETNKEISSLHGRSRRAIAAQLKILVDSLWRQKRKTKRTKP